MKNMRMLLSVLFLVFGLAVSAQAALVDMTDGTIYDTDTQLSWLKNANMAGTTMNWTDANAWAASLNTLNDGSGYAYLTGWRLPTMTQPDTNCTEQLDPDGEGGIPAESWGNYCINSEMGHLFYTELGNEPLPVLLNAGPFTDLQAGLYWSVTEYAPYPESDAWRFDFFSGGICNDEKISTYYALAVRPGCRMNCGSPTPVGYNPQWLIVTLVSLMGAGGYLLRRRTEQ